MKNLSFKNKIIALITIIVSITILTSYVSVNYFISQYINDSDTRNISHNIELVKTKLSTDMQRHVNLAKSLTFSMMDIAATKEHSDLYKVVQLVNQNNFYW